VDGRRGGPGRFAEPWLLVLTSLADGPKHGYAIMTDVAAFTGVAMEPGTVYRALSLLERRGWVRPLAAGTPAAGMRSPPSGRPGQVMRVAPGGPCVAAAVDRPVPYSLQLSKRY